MTKLPKSYKRRYT